MIIQSIKTQELGAGVLTSFQLGPDDFAVVMVNWNMHTIELNRGNRKELGTWLTTPVSKEVNP